MKNSYKKDHLIHIEKSYELWDWAAKFKVSAETLQQAVLKVGKSAEAVSVFLKK